MLGRSNGSSSGSGSSTPSDLVDYIIEESVDSATGLSYRKWKNGDAEVWGKISVSVPSWVAWGSSYYNSGYTSYSYPAGLFIDVPTTFQVAGTGAADAWTCTGGLGTKDKTPTLYFMRPVSASAGTYYFNIHAIGKWK